MACAAGMGVCSLARATTEAEAADELIAVLGATLPCPRYAVAWLANPPSRIEHRCAASLEKATELREEVPSKRLYYAIDMRLARDRYAAVYRFRGTPTPAVVHAQFLANVVTLGGSDGKAGRHFSPLIVYGRSTVPLAPPMSLVVSPQPLEARKAMVFPR